MRPGASPTHDTNRPRERGRTPASAPDARVASLVAGLGLLWPWLATHLEATADRLARLDPVEARRLALAALVPDLQAAVDDPVVCLLAGDDVDHEPSLVVVTERELRLAAEGADAVLDGFAAALPGFAGSTPEFVRRNFLVRAGVVEPTVDPVTIRLAPLPLDPVLSLLGYPIGTFRLPWSRPIALRLEYG